MIDTWIPDLDAIPVLDEASVSQVRERVRSVGAALPPIVVANMVLVASELAMNQLHHARSGLVAVRSLERDGVSGLEIVAGDQGDGIRDPRHAFAAHGVSQTGLGVGLGSVRKLAREIDVAVCLQEGTCIWARAFASPVTRRREVGIFGRPHRTEQVSGDLATFVRTPSSLVVALVDGLGHGLEARAASHAAIRSFSQHPESPGEQILESCHDAIGKTRGAVMTVARVDEVGGVVHASGVGNVTLSVSSPKTSKRFEGSSFVLGVQRPMHRARTEEVSLGSHAAVILFSDGITTRATLDDRPELLREQPIVIAQELVKDFGRDDDDVTVLVAR